MTSYRYFNISILSTNVAGSFVLNNLMLLSYAYSYFIYAQEPAAGYTLA